MYNRDQQNIEGASKNLNGEKRKNKKSHNRNEEQPQIARKGGTNGKLQSCVKEGEKITT